MIRTQRLAEQVVDDDDASRAFPQQPTHDGGTGREDLRHLQVSNDNYLEFARMQDRIAERAEQLGLICQFIRPLALNYPTTEIPLHPVAIPTLIGQRESRWRSLLRLATRN